MFYTESYSQDANACRSACSSNYFQCTSQYAYSKCPGTGLPGDPMAAAHQACVNQVPEGRRQCAAQDQQCESQCETTTPQQTNQQQAPQPSTQTYQQAPQPLTQTRTRSPEGAEVYIISPKDGAKVHNPVLVQFGLKGMGIAPAGIMFDNTGHHHLLIDTDLIDLSAPLAANERIVHFGKGQTETTVSLTPGTHTLQLLLSDAYHVPHNPPVISKRISITVLP